MMKREPAVNQRAWWRTGTALRALTFVTVIGLAGGSMGSSCFNNLAANTVKDATAKAADILSNGISTISSNSQLWNDTLTSMVGQLTDQAQSTVRNELTNLLNGSIALASTEVRCDIDFIGKRVVQALLRIKAELLLQPPPDVLDPHVCSAVPAAIDFHLWQTSPQSIQSVSFYGFDLDEPSLKLSLIDTAGNRDVTASMVRTSTYQLTINLGSNGVKLTPTSSKLQLVAHDNAASPVGELAVLQPKLPLCQTLLKDVVPTGLPKFIPPWTGVGDREYQGHGPKVTAMFDLNISGTTSATLKGTLYIDAKETQSNFTEAQGQISYPLWNADPGWAIDSFVTPTHSEINYTDTTTGDPGSAADDKFLGGNGPVSNWLCSGDTSGDDAGVKTGCTVETFNLIRIKLVQTQGCVTSQVAKRLLNDKRTSPETVEHLKTLLPGP